MADFTHSLQRFINALPVVGPAAKQAFGDPDQEKLQAQIEQMRQAYSQYRPEIAQARMTGLGNQLSLFGPISQMLGQMYGPSAVPDTSKLMQSPLAGVQGAVAPHQVNSTSGRPLFMSNSPGPKIPGGDDQVAVARL